MQDTKAVLTGWLLGSKRTRTIVLTAGLLWALVKGIAWCIRNPRYSLPPFAGLCIWIRFGSLTAGALTALALYALVILHWAWRLLGKSEIDTWSELIHGLPQLWRLHRTWPYLSETEISRIRVTPTGLSATATSGTQNIARLKKDELDLAAGLRADRVIVTPTSSWTGTVTVDWGKEFWNALEHDGKHVLYGLTDTSGNIIYVGRTAIHRGTEPHLLNAYSEDDLARRAARHRLTEHRHDQPWADEIADTTVLGIYPSLQAVSEAEEDMIRRLGPTLYNKAGSISR